jgi:hypothetical protein
MSGLSHGTHMTLRCTLLIFVALLVADGRVTRAQPARPRPLFAPVVDTSPVRTGSNVRLSLTVRLPPHIHVQSDKPRDPALIPTALTLKPPAGVTVKEIVYPPSTDLTQQGASEPLAVFSGEFTIKVGLQLAADVSPGDLAIPAQMRYQACDDAVCYPPAREDVSWTVRVEPRRKEAPRRRK